MNTSAMRNLLATTVLPVFLAASGTVFAQVTPPARVNYQGVVRNASGNPLNGPVTMTFRFYDAASAGLLLWEELYDPATRPPEVAVSSGLFTVPLGDPAHRNAGSEANFLDVFSLHATVYLAVQVAADPEMTPRIRVVAAPFAGNASRLEGLSSASYAKPGTAETITADWDNTANPWTDAEVSNVLTLGAGSTIDPSIPVGNAATLDTFDSSYFLDTSATAQSKTGKLTVNNTDVSPGFTRFGIDAYGWDAGGYFHSENFGIDARGSVAGGSFQCVGNSGAASVAAGPVGIYAVGFQAGGHFLDTDSGGEAYAGYGSYGVYASGNTAGGYFFTANGSGLARLGYGNIGINAYGTDYGGRFDSGTPSIASADLAYSWLFGGTGIVASGTYEGGYFRDSNNSGLANVAYYDYGIYASGNNMGGYFNDSNATGYARVGYGDTGIDGLGNASGGYFQDLNSSGWTGIGQDTYKVLGNGGVSFVQNHPLEKDRVIVYSAPEGDEVATYTRGTARLVDGEARIQLGQTFQWVTNPDIGLTVHLTPRGGWADLYTEQVSTTDLVVRSHGGSPNTAFDYVVYGLRIGFEEASIVQEKTREAFIPSFKEHRERYEKHPELRAYNSLERFRGMESSVLGNSTASIDMTRAKSLKDAIHEYDPAVDGPVDRDRASNPPPRVLADRPEGSDLASIPTTVSSRPRLPLPTTPHQPAAVGSVEPSGTRSPEIRPALPCLPVSEVVEVGDLLVMDAGREGFLSRCSAMADPFVVGIAGGPEVVCLEDPSAWATDVSSRVPVVVSGFASCKVDASYGAIRRGDLLVASPTPGHAMRTESSLPGTVIGKALESLEAGMGNIKILVMLR